MKPSLGRRGFLVLVCGFLFVLLGALRAAPLLAGLGTAILAALLVAHLLFFSVVKALSRRRIELSWWVSPPEGAATLTASRPFVLHFALRHHGRRELRTVSAQIVGSSALTFSVIPPTALQGGWETEQHVMVECCAAGDFVLHGASVTFTDLLGLFVVDAYFPNPLAMKVFPPVQSARTAHILALPRLGSLERAGPQLVRRRGPSGDLRELRDHAPGDPFKRIAWKASARRGRLLVRELESEVLLRRDILVDTGASMRRGPLGSAPFDHAVESAATAVRRAIDAGDRVSLTLFDTRITCFVPAADGTAHALKLVDKLMSARHAIDEDLTDITDGAIIALVSGYLAQQEGVDARIPWAPAVDDPLWERLATGPHGELYDLRRIENAVRALLGPARSKAAPAVLLGAGADPAMSVLRQFCRRRGLELPYRALPRPAARAAGFAEALHKVALDGRGHELTIFTDGTGFSQGWAEVAHALQLCETRHHRLFVVLLQGTAFWPPRAGELGRKLDRAHAAPLEDERDWLRRELMRRGIRTRLVTPQDHPSQVATFQKGRRRSA